MADLLTHMALAHTLKRLSPHPSRALTFLVGTSLPDLLGRAPNVISTLLFEHYDFALPPPLLIGMDALHQPFPFLLCAFFIALWFPEKERKSVFRNLLMGGWLHMLIDLPQTHIYGGYRLGFPFFRKPVELGWIGTEDSLRIMPFLVVLALVVELHFRHARKKAGAEAPL